MLAQPPGSDRIVAVDHIAAQNRHRAPKKRRSPANGRRWLRSNAVLAICMAWLAACSITPFLQSPVRPYELMSLSLPDGQSLAYRVTGKKHTTAPILFIHGIPDA